MGRCTTAEIFFGINLGHDHFPWDEDKYFDVDEYFFKKVTKGEGEYDWEKREELEKSIGAKIDLAYFEDYIEYYAYTVRDEYNYMIEEIDTSIFDIDTEEHTDRLRDLFLTLDLMDYWEKPAFHVATSYG